MTGLESIKDMHMIHCVCPNRTQQWLTAMCLPFSASSEGRIRNLGLGSKIGTFLGPFWHFGPIWDKVPNLGPFWSACISPKMLRQSWPNIGQFQPNIKQERLILRSNITLQQQRWLPTSTASSPPETFLSFATETGVQTFMTRTTIMMDCPIRGYLLV